MSFLPFSRKQTAKVSSDSAWLAADLTANLTYMSAIASSQASRDKVLDLSSRQSFTTAVYFRQVYLLSKKLGLEYSRAFQIVAKKAKAANVKSLLLRFASSISSGESEEDFLATQAKVEREVYFGQYHRQLDTLQKWGDAYSALMVSVTVIVVISLVTSMIKDSGDAFVAMLSFTGIMMAFVGGFIIYKTAPYEVKTYVGIRGPWKRRWAIRLFLWVMPVAVVAAILLQPMFGAGMVFLVLGLGMIPSGFLAFQDDSLVNKMEQEVAPFIRGLGNITSALGGTVGVGLKNMDRKSMGTLEPYIKRLQSRLDRRLSPDVCWELFRDEVGSDLVAKTTRMFVDGCRMGGDPQMVGEIAADYALGIALLRAKRAVTSSTFAYLTIPLHGAMVGLLVFILEVVRTFNNRLMTIAAEVQADVASGASSGASSMPALPMFETKDLGVTGMLLLSVMIVLTLVDSVAPRFATGGHPIKTAFYGSMMCITSGLGILLIPPVIAKILG
jgi:archaeal flagellar protein FlaJ